jgi:hypothetical protein
MDESDDALSFFDLLVALWEISNFAVGLVLKFLFLVPVLLMLLALFGFQELVGWLTLVILAAGVFAIISTQPLIVPLINEIRTTTRDPGPQLLRFLKILVAADILLALYLALVPVANSPKLIPIVVLSAVTLVLLSKAQWGGVGCLRAILVALIVVPTFVFFSYDKGIIGFFRGRYLQPEQPITQRYHLLPGKWTVATLPPDKSYTQVDFQMPSEFWIRYQMEGPNFIKVPQVIVTPMGTTQTLDANRNPVKDQGINQYNGQFTFWMMPKGNEPLDVAVVIQPKK